MLLGIPLTFSHHIIQPHADSQTSLSKMPFTTNLGFLFHTHSFKLFFMRPLSTSSEMPIILWYVLTGGDFASWGGAGHLAKCGDISGCPNWGCYWCLLVEVRDATKHPTMSWGQSSRQRIIWPQMSIMPIEKHCYILGPKLLKWLCSFSPFFSCSRKAKLYSS